MYSADKTIQSAMVNKSNNKQQQQQRPLAATDRSSMNPSGSFVDNTFCVVLHVVEAINFYGREMREGERDQIVMNAALNSVDFEVEGTPSVTTETIIFNSNCIWECDMAGIKRIKTDHRPVKVTFFASNSASSSRKTIGSLLLPVRGIPVLGLGGNNSPLQLKMFWHKLICISSEFRSHKPEVLLMLAIIKKSLLHTKDFKHLMVFNNAEKQPRGPPLQSPGHSITANMLQSQANVYVQSLVQLGLLQVGNNPLVDCDIIEVVLQFKQLKNLNRFVKSIFQGKDVDTVLLMFDFVGNVTNIELKLNESDCYTLDDVLGLRFKSSLNSIRLYFQRIFYLPINMYIKGTSIANYRMDFGKMLPSDLYFSDQRKYMQSGSFAFERFGRMGSARELKPIMDYTFSVDIQEVCWRQQGGQSNVPQQEQQQSDQLSLHCATSKAVIHEVPKDRVIDNAGDWQSQDPDGHCKPDTVSINSLNVGAELSDSDERESPVEPALSDAHDSDDGGGHKIHGRRKKFTRLVDALEIEQQDAGILDMAEDIDSEAELLGLYNNSKFCHQITTVEYEENVLQKTKECVEVSTKVKLQETSSQQTKSKNENRKMQMDESACHKENNRSERVKIVGNNPWLQLEKEYDQKSQDTPKDNPNEQNIKMVHKLRRSKIIPNDKMHLDFPESDVKSKVAVRKNISNDKALNVEPNILSQRKGLLKTDDELEQLEVAEMAKIIHKSSNTSKPLSQNRYLMSDDSFLKAENDIELECESQKSQNLRKSRKRFVDGDTVEADTTTDTEIKEKSGTRKTKSKVFVQVESEVCETVIDRQPQKMKQMSTSKAELSLRARWVEVNKNQRTMLEETERFIGETIKGANYLTEEPFSGSSTRSSPKKLDRNHVKPRSKIDIKMPLNEEQNLEHKTMKKKAPDNICENSQEMPPPTNKLFPKARRGNEARDFEKLGSTQSSAQKSSRIVKQSLAHAPEESTSKQPVTNRYTKELPETESSELEMVTTQRKKMLKKKSSRTAKSGDECCGSATSKSQLEVDTQLSRFEVTVHMYDQTKGAETTKQVVDGDVNNMNESLQQILSVSMGLQREMQLKALEYLRSLSQQPSQVRLDKHSQSTPVNESNNMDANYNVKFKELEEHIIVLEDHLRQFESRTFKMQEENSKLAQEKMQLKQRICHMEQQIEALRHGATNGNDLSQMLNELRHQNVRYNDLAKARDHYKKQWRHAAKRIHVLKLAMHEKNVQHQYETLESNVINLKSILTQDADEFEREFGRFRNTTVSFPGSNDSSEPLLKDYLRGLSPQTLDKHIPANSVDSTRMH
ncbi:uncharacterized protein LOC133839494 isoform X1 [Drosophila sulfurigaster albostrigata]|uniref:uncharacterized protein LOC133839494 isoform X1 n=1 Tax=Drosophila sulfurigaster albostrigata TaxID=89887 RepID=UPI002D21EBF9|nr:uncharacterized protein LOC133839494 isoform X1 [Drosophila sulfurigaster albostrigata]